MNFPPEEKKPLQLMDRVQVVSLAYRNESKPSGKVTQIYHHNEGRLRRCVVLFDDNTEGVFFEFELARASSSS